MYSVLDYGRMAADGVRIDAYARAIASVVKPGDVVVDLGAGTGVFSLLAARAGASRVHAVDVNPGILLLPDLAASNGLEDQIQIHHGSSLELTLSEKADVIVSDMRGNTPLNGDHVAAIRDARRRLLKPGGALLPSSDELFVQIVESPTLMSRIEQGWQSFERLGITAREVRHSVLNGVYDDRAAPLDASNILTSAGSWASLDYATFDRDTIDGSVDVPATRRGTAHGLVVWFEATVYPGITYRTAPGWSLAYARMFVPLLEPVDVVFGDRVRITMRADAHGERWAWETTFLSATGATKSEQKQSTFFGMPAEPSELLRLASSHRPTLSAHGSRVAKLLAAMNGERTIGDLASDHSGDRDAALREVRDVVRAYAR